MKLTCNLSSLAVLFCTLPLAAQSGPAKQEGVPLYRVTVVERTTKAVNYQYRSGPTKIDFRGTVLMPAARGEATVESLRGRTVVDAKFENLTPPTQFGHEYLTYTLWAITPQGRARSLGEVVPDGSNKAKLHVTTDMQAFGLIVTAEPYSATRLPSDVVVMENEIRPDTMGLAKPIEAKYELLPRGQYTWEVPAKLRPDTAGPKVSMDKYEATLELYEAQNAVGIARNAGAEQYAGPTFQRAESLLTAAQRLQATGPTSLVVQNAREAAETAEDARMIADRRRQEERVTNAEAEAARAKQVQAQAEAGVRQAQIEADQARAQAEAERAARQRAEADAAEARNRADRAEAAAAQATQVRAPAAPAPPSVPKQTPQQTDLRMRLYEQLNAALLTRDTPRGLVTVVPDSAFAGSDLRESFDGQIKQIAKTVAANPGLRLEVEGFADSAAGAATSWRRAQAVQRVLISQGLSAATVTAKGLGDEQPVASNATAEGRTQNRRVEIVISGNPIGTLPFWDRTYTLSPGSRPN